MWLKNYFKANKKFGSKDRRVVADLCFCFFRLGDAFADKRVEERLLIAQLLCHDASDFVDEAKPEWKVIQSKPVTEKLMAMGGDAHALFPFHQQLSNEIETDAFCLSHLVQPDVFLRVRPGRKQAVEEKLRAASIHFSTTDDCIRIAANTKLDAVVEIDVDAVVQDKNSQAVIQLLKKHWQQQRFSLWDCCAASGGKCLLLHDHYPKATITATDVRESILHNLRSRFRRAGVHNYRSFVADVASPGFLLPHHFDVIICDAPCSGSGTWGRTPEQLSLFVPEKIDHYQRLQQRIATAAAAQLNQGGLLLYITCSVFKKENEDVVAHLQSATTLTLIEQQYFKGYDENADTLFAALFRL